MHNYSEILNIQSDKNNLIKVEIFLRLFFQKKDLPLEYFQKVLLVVSEAVLNAIEHGNKNDFHKNVKIKASCLSNDLIIEVEDEGEGFDFSKVPDPRERANLKKEAGRGIFIMKSICNRLNFRDRGKCVEIKMELT